jgi:molybdate transport system substrate-binding protein
VRSWVGSIRGAIVALGLGWAGTASAADLNVFAATSLTESLQEIGESWSEQHPDIRPVFNFTASSALALQIQEGAPADVFFSADEAKMDGLEKRNLLSPGTRFSLLSNTLVIVVHQDSRLAVTKAADLQAASFAHIALAEPQTVPAGIYAKEYLRQQGVWSKVIDKVIPTENVRAALAAVESGNVQAGIVYKTDAAISKQVRVAYEVAGQRRPEDLVSRRCPEGFHTIRSREAIRRLLALRGGARRVPRPWFHRPPPAPAERTKRKRRHRSGAASLATPTDVSQRMIRTRFTVLSPGPSIR